MGRNGGLRGDSKMFRAGGPALTHENQASTPQTEAADQVLIATLVRCLQIVQQLAALVHHLEQTAARVMVVLVTREVVRKLRDPRRQQRDLDFRRAGVGRASAVFTDDGGFLVRLEGHADRLQPRYPAACFWPIPRSR